MKKLFFTFLSIIFFANAAYCIIDAATGEEIKGYKGTLPNITTRFQRLSPQVSTPNFEKTNAFNVQKGYKPVPRDNPSYVNVIIKKNKLSEYANDINELLPVVEKLINSLEKNENEQLFAARANYLYDNTEHLRKKYQDRPESYYNSYNSLIESANQAKALLNLRKEAKVYSSYLAYNNEGYIYSPKYINSQMKSLLRLLKNTISLMKDVD